MTNNKIDFTSFFTECYVSDNEDYWFNEMNEVCNDVVDLKVNPNKKIESFCGSVDDIMDFFNINTNEEFQSLTTEQIVDYGQFVINDYLEGQHDN